MKELLDRLEFRDSGNRDLILFAMFLALSLCGLLILYPASSIVAYRDTGDADYYVKKQAIWFAAGFFAMIVFSVIPLELLRKLALPGIVFSFLLLVLVFLPGIGHSVSSRRESFHRWIGFAGFTFQPSEFAKIAIVSFAASVFARPERKEGELDIRRLVLPVLLILMNLVAIILEPQYGTTVCILLVLVFFVYISGFPVVRLFLIFLATLPLLYLLIILWEYRLDRFRVWLNPYEFRHEGGYQLVTSFRAFMEGSFAGENLASGYAHSYLTYGHTDFIFALFAEDFGWLGTTAFFLFFMAVLWKTYSLLSNVTDTFAFLLGSGCLLMLGLQTILNLCVVSGLLPTTGVSLPFLSYGGSSLIVSMSFAGILVNVSSRSRRAGMEGLKWKSAF